MLIPLARPTERGWAGDGLENRGARLSAELPGAVGERQAAWRRCQQSSGVLPDHRVSDESPG